MIMFMVYILSRIVDKFFLRSAALAVKEHSDFALLGADHNRLILKLLYVRKSTVVYSFSG